MLRPFLQASSPVAIITLLFNNLVPLLGVLYWGWDLYSVILIYWLENGVIGFYNVLKMVMAQGKAPLTEKDLALAQHIGLQTAQTLHRITRYIMIPFFLIHYGMFWLGHGVFVQAFFGSFLSSGAFFSLAATPFMQQWLPVGALGALTTMLVSHGSSFVRNYIGHGEYLVTTPEKLMSQPYARVVVLHITILVGGILVMGLGEPLYALLLLIVLKSGVDLFAHLREHQRYLATSLQPVTS
jgi:hypothetical protein